MRATGRNEVETVEPATLTSPGKRGGRQPAPGPERGRDQPARIPFDRRRAIEDAEHVASVHRLRQAAKLGLVVWPGTGLLDWWIVASVGKGSLSTLLLLRGLGLLVVALVFVRVNRSPPPSRRVLRLLDFTGFTGVCVLVSLMCVHLGGISSVYATGIAVVLVARGATMCDRWRSGAWRFGLPALSYPVVVMAAAGVDGGVRAQLADIVQLGYFGVSLTFIATTWLLLTVGGNFVWLLRREALEAKRVGRYTLERRLGRGGMGEVWAAYDSRLKQRVALKMLRSRGGNPSAVARFEREVRALARLTHPNIVTVFDYGVTDDGTWYYAMELLDGQSLSQLVEAEGPLAAEVLAPIALQVSAALAEAHGKGVIHRDIKPENIFITRLGGQPHVAKLLDFGVAKTFSADDETLTATGWVAGTPAYMAPEVLRGQQVDVRSDLYSLGATFYFALTGKRPFGTLRSQELLEAQLSRRPAPLSAAATHTIPELLAKIIERCLESDRALRYATGRELLAALEGARGQP